LAPELSAQFTIAPTGRPNEILSFTPYMADLDFFDILYKLDINYKFI